MSKNVNVTNAKKTKMPWLLLASGFVFIINPNISIIDPLPDFIGYIIISLALTKLSLLCEALTDARRAFERMILIDGGKTLALVWVFGMESASERASSLLLWSFVFSTLEAIFLIPSYFKLFKGLSDLGDYHPNTSIHNTEGKKSHTDKIKLFTIVFIVFKAVMTVLPEFADLSNASYDETSIFVNIYEYIGIMRALACIPVLALGIAWLANIVKYFKRISDDVEFNASLIEKYETQVLPKQGRFIMRYVKTASWLLIAAAVLTLDLKIEGGNIIPDILVLTTLIPAFAMLSKATDKIKKSEYVAFVLYGIASIASLVADGVYNEIYTYNAMNKNFAAFVFYMCCVMLVALKGIAFICTLSLLVKRVGKAIESHTGYVSGREIHTEGEKRRIAEVQRELKKAFSLVLDVAVVYVLSDVVYALYGAIYAFLRHNAGYLNVVNLVCGLVFIGMTVRATDALREAVNTKYMLE